MAIPTATSDGVSVPVPIPIVTVGRVLYALPVVVNATDVSSILDPSIPPPLSIVADATLVPG